MYVCYYFDMHFISNFLVFPKELTPQEISTYTEFAENVWYNGLETAATNENIAIEYDLETKTVKVFDRTSHKASVTVDFSNENHKVTINKFETNYIVAIILLTLVWIIIFSFLLWIIIKNIKDHKNKKKTAIPAT